MRKKRWLSVLLCFALVFSLLPTTAFAVESEPAAETTCIQSADCQAELHTEGCTAALSVPASEPTEIPTEATDAFTEPTEMITEPPTEQVQLPEQPTEPTEEVTEPTPVRRVQALIDALPEADSITAENAEDVKAQLTVIDEAKAALSDEELDSLDISRYMGAMEALSILEGRTGENTPETQAETGAFTVTGGVSGTDYSYSGMVLTIRSGTPLTISNTDPSAAITDHIEVEGGVSANITLAGVNIDVSAQSNTAAFKIANNSGGNVTINLAEGTTNTLKSGENCAGLQKSGHSGKLTINGPGTLNATGGNRGAGIGGESGGFGGNITINGGNISATTAMWAAGIGGGDNAAGGNITINGGTVYAKGGTNGEGIGGGTNSVGSNILITGGHVSAFHGSSEKAGLSALSTGADGNAVIVTDKIRDRSDQDNWSGVIFEGSNDGQVYGTTVTLGEDVAIPSDKTLIVPEGTTLTVPGGKTLVNNGAIYVDGILSGTVDGTKYYRLTVTGGTASPINTHDSKTYGLLGETITLTAEDKVGQSASWKSNDVTLVDNNTFTMPSKVVTVTAEYTNAPTYTVTIPASAEVGNTATISATGVNVVSGSTLTVKIDESTSFTMTSGEGATLNYAVHKDNASGTLLNAGSNILTIAGGTKNDAASADLAFTLASGEVETYSGVYKGSITFHVSLTNATP